MRSSRPNRSTDRSRLRPAPSQHATQNSLPPDNPLDDSPPEHTKRKRGVEHPIYSARLAAGYCLTKVVAFKASSWAWLLRLCSVLILAVTVEAVATTPVKVATTSPYISCIFGSASPCTGHWVGQKSATCPTRGYHLSRVDTYYTSPSILGFKLYWDTDVAGAGA